MTRSVTAVLLAVLLTPGAAPLAAQQNRAELIDQARNEFDLDVRLDLLARAVDPGLGAADSLWAVAAFDLAQLLVGSAQPEGASLWLRWAARHGPEWPIDRTYYSPSMIEAYERAVADVRGGVGPDDDAVATGWRWPGRFDAAAPGVIEVATADPAVPLTVSVEGVGSVTIGRSGPVAVGTYEIVAAADGFEPARVTREVLPGVTTMLEFDLAPLLPPASAAAMAHALVMIRYTAAGEQVCANGVLAGAGGLVLASRTALGRTGGLEVVTSERVIGDRSVAHSDPGLDLAVIRLGAAPRPALPRAAAVADRQHAWALYRTGCDEPISAPTRLSGWRPGAPVGLSPPLPPEARGAPLVDRTGALIGLVRAADVMTPITLADGLLALAEAPEPTPQLRITRRGGPRWVWIGAGAAALGAAAVALAGGSGSNGQPAATTGGIIIVFPGGA
jgi:hypothetical protein